MIGVYGSGGGDFLRELCLDVAEDVLRVEGASVRRERNVTHDGTKRSREIREISALNGAHKSKIHQIPIAQTGRENTQRIFLRQIL